MTAGLPKSESNRKSFKDHLGWDSFMKLAQDRPNHRVGTIFLTKYWVFVLGFVRLDRAQVISPIEIKFVARDGQS